MTSLLDALEYHLQFRDWKLMWIGEISKATEERINQSPTLSSRVICTGYRKDARELIAQADIYAQPTLEPGEGIGNAVAEAMAAELPVVTSNIGGAPELVRPISPELLFEPENPASLAFTLEKLLTNGDLCEQLGRAGAEVLSKKFRLNNEIQQYADLFEAHIFK